MTAEGSTGAPLRQQIAETIHETDCPFVPGCAEGATRSYYAMADAVVALLNLTEEATTTRTETVKILGRYCGREQVLHDTALVTGSPWAEMAEFPVGATVQRKVITIRTPWLPSTPPDTSSSETA